MEQGIFMSIYVHTYVYMHSITISVEKGSRDYSGKWGGDILEALEGGKGREKCYNIQGQLHGTLKVSSKLFKNGFL